MSIEEKYIAAFGGIPKAPAALVVQDINAGVWGIVPAPMNASRAEFINRSTVRPGR